MFMTEAADVSILTATQYVHEVCSEVLALTKVLEQQFKNKMDELGVVIDSIRRWPNRGTGSEFFDAYSCQFLLKGSRRARKIDVGHATYLFDLGAKLRYAAAKQCPLVVVAWSAADYGPYEIGSLEVAATNHQPFAERLMRWVNDETELPDDGSWFYAVPLTKVQNENDVDRLLINPLVAIASEDLLTTTVAAQAFKDAHEVLIHEPSRKAS